MCVCEVENAYVLSLESLTDSFGPCRSIYFPLFCFIDY